MSDDRLISIKEVCALTSMSKTTIYKLIKLGQFPDRFNAGQVRVVWSYNEVQNWIKSIKKTA